MFNHCKTLDTMKTVTIPFDLELAKKIQGGEVEGKIVDKRKTEYEIVKWDARGDYPLIGVYFDEQLNTSYASSFTTYHTRETNIY